ncbi:unnamed protein product [Closterium sp. NIES-64]|nr:unnamed protein product [Closterium sp. NIES-64]
MTPLAALLGSPQTAGIALSGPDASPPPMLLPSPPVSPVGNSCAGDGEASAFLPADSASAAGGAGRRAPRRAGSWRVSESAGRAEGVGGSGGDSPHGVAEGEAGEAGGAGEGGCFYESVRVPRDVVRVWQDCWRGAWQADVEIRSAVDGGLVLAQGAVLAAHSQGLERMLAGAMLQQARPPWVIVLKGVPVEAIRGVVQALYCGTMDDALMDRHVFHLLLLAHSLPIPLLKSLCLEALRSRLLSPTNAVDTLVLARLVGSRALQALTQQYIVRHHADVALTDAWAMLSQEYPDVKQMLVQMVEARKRRDTGLHGEEAWARQQVQQAVRALEHICNDGSCATSASASASVSSPPPAAPPCAAPASASSAEPSSASAVESGGGRAGTGVEGDGAEEGGGGRRMEGAEGEEAKGREPGGAATAAVGAATAAVGAATAAVGAATAAVGAAADTSSTDSQNQPDEILQSQGGQKGPIGQLGHSGPNTLSPTTTLAPTLSSLSSSSSLLSVRPMSPPTPATPAVPPTPCGLPKCRPVEGLIRHFAKCGVKVSGGCGSCKVVWQLLEQHSSACEKHKGCRVPLCRQFKSKQQQEQGSGLPAAGKEKLSAAEHAEQVTALAKALLALEDAKSPHYLPSLSAASFISPRCSSHSPLLVGSAVASLSSPSRRLFVALANTRVTALPSSSRSPLPVRYSPVHPSCPLALAISLRSRRLPVLPPLAFDVPSSFPSPSMSPLPSRRPHYLPSLTLPSMSPFSFRRPRDIPSPSRRLSALPPVACPLSLPSPSRSPSRRLSALSPVACPLPPPSPSRSPSRCLSALPPFAFALSLPSPVRSSSPCLRALSPIAFVLSLPSASRPPSRLLRALPPVACSPSLPSPSRSLSRRQSALPPIALALSLPSP